jgi:hypothetical protein
MERELILEAADSLKADEDALANHVSPKSHLLLVAFQVFSFRNSSLSLMPILDFYDPKDRKNSSKVARCLSSSLENSGAGEN